MRARRKREGAGEERKEEEEERDCEGGIVQVVISRWLNVRGGFELYCDRSWTYEGRERCYTAIRLTRFFWDNGYYLMAEYGAARPPTIPMRRMMKTFQLGVDGISRTECIPLRATVPNGFCVFRTSLSRQHREKFVLGSYLSKLT